MHYLHKIDRSDGSGFIYLICAERRRGYKIGKSIDMQSRFRPLAFEFGKITLIVALEVRDARIAERQMHARYADKRLDGEWFDLSDNEIEEFCHFRWNWRAFKLEIPDDNNSDSLWIDGFLKSVPTLKEMQMEAISEMNKRLRLYDTDSDYEYNVEEELRRPDWKEIRLIGDEDEEGVSE